MARTFKSVIRNNKRRNRAYALICSAVCVGCLLIFGRLLFSTNDDKITYNAPAVSSQDVTSALQARSSAIYDLTLFLNIHTFEDEHIFPPDGSAILNDISTVSRIYPNSLAAEYHSLSSVCAVKPYVPHIQKSLDIFGKQFDRNVSNDKLVKLAQRDDVLVVQVNPYAINLTDMMLGTDDFIQNYTSMVKDFSQVVLIPDCVICHEMVIETLKTIARTRKAKVTVRQDLTRHVDMDIYTFHVAKNVLVHSGAVGALAALSATGGVTATQKLAPYIDNQWFKWSLKNGGTTKPSWLEQQFQALGPVKPSCCVFTEYGYNCDSKILCGNTKFEESESCWVLSIGCGNLWDFERDIIKRTNCSAQVFDCTRPWKVPDDLVGRVKFHKICVASGEESSDEYKTMGEIFDIGAESAGFSRSKGPIIAKIDVEGFEFGGIKNMFQVIEEDRLPEQMAVEVHVIVEHPMEHPYQKVVKPDGKTVYQVPTQEMTKFFDLISSHGYDYVYRADNRYVDECIETTLVRRKSLPPVG